MRNTSCHTEQKSDRHIWSWRLDNSNIFKRDDRCKHILDSQIEVPLARTMLEKAQKNGSESCSYEGARGFMEKSV